MNRNLVFALLIATFFATAPVSAAGRPGIVVLPFDNLSGAQNAPATIDSFVVKAVITKGWDVAAHDAVEKILEDNRVRYLDSLDDSVRTTVVQATNANAVLSGTIYSYIEGRNPIIAVSARLIRADGSLAWADIAASSADDTEGVFGFGRAPTIEFLAHDVVDVLLDEFPKAGTESEPVQGKSKPFMHRGPASFHVPDLDAGRPHLVCVLPFENTSSMPEAARVVADVLSIRLAAAKGFEVVEPAKLREAALKAHIGSFRGIGTDDLARLASAVGTPLFLRGTIFQYTEAIGRSADPELQIDLSLVDAQAGRILWAAQHDRKGSDYTGFLMLGAASNAVTLTDRVVTEMIATAARGPKGAANGPARAALRTKEQQTELRGRTKGGK